MGVREDLSTKGYSVSEVNPPELSLTEWPWGYYRHIDGRIVYLPADPLTLRRNRNKGFVFLGDTPPNESPDNEYVINYSI